MRRPPITTRTEPLVPSTTHCRTRRHRPSAASRRPPYRHQSSPVGRTGRDRGAHRQPLVSPRRAAHRGYDHGPVSPSPPGRKELMDDDFERQLLRRMADDERGTWREELRADFAPWFDDLHFGLAERKRT